MFKNVFVFAVSATIFTTSQAFAWGDMYMGDGTHNPNSVAPAAYHGPNYCPQVYSLSFLAASFAAVQLRAAIRR